MSDFNLKIITPRRIVFDNMVESVSVPGKQGVLTILKHHENLFALLTEGIVKIKTRNHEDYIAIGGGYVETNGEEMAILVSRAYHQDEIDRRATEKAMEEAKKILTQSKDEKQRKEAATILRRSIVELKLLKKKAPRSFNEDAL